MVMCSIRTVRESHSYMHYITASVVCIHYVTHELYIYYTQPTPVSHLLLSLTAHELASRELAPCAFGCTATHTATTHCNTHCNTLQHTLRYIIYYRLPRFSALARCPRTRLLRTHALRLRPHCNTHCNTHRSTHCNTHCNTLQHTLIYVIYHRPPRSSALARRPRTHLSRTRALCLQENGESCRVCG